MLVDTTLARRIDQTTALFNRLWLEGAAARDGNPHGLEFFSRGAVVASASEAQPDNPTMNRALDLTAADLEYVRPLISWYRRKGIWPWFDVGPAEGADALLDALAAEGAWPVGFVQVSAGAALPLGDESAPGVSVEPVDGDSIGIFAETLMAGHAIEQNRLKEAAADVGNWHQLPGLFALLARVDGVPAGAAVLFVRDGAGLLADSSTLLPHRGRGVGAALLAARIRLAADVGCDLVAGTSRFGSTTHLELQRCGLVSGYTRATLHLGG